MEIAVGKRRRAYETDLNTKIVFPFIIHCINVVFPAYGV